MIAVPTSFPFGTLLEQLRSSVDRGQGPGPVTWLVTPKRGAVRPLLDALSADAARRGSTCAVVDCDRPFPVPFAPVRDLIHQLLPHLEREAPEVVADHRPELLGFLPDLAERPEWSGQLAITDIALGGTKRRLQKDSEVLLRMVRGFASLVITASRRLDDAGAGPVTLLVDNFDAADRLTLSAIHHLGRRAGTAPISLVLAGCDPDDPNRPDPWLWAAEPAVGNEQADRLTDAYSLHKAVVGKVIDALQPARLTLNSGVVDLQTLAESSKSFSRAYRGAAPTHEEGLLALYREALDAGDTDGAVEHGIAAGAQAFTFSHNYEAILLTCRDLLRTIPRPLNPRSRGQAVAVWQLLGLAHAYLERYDDSVAGFAESFRLSTCPEIRAQSCYFAGLVRAKRQGNLDLGSKWFAVGLDELADLDSPEARLERGWLLNGSALVAWLRGNHTVGHALVAQALRSARPTANVQLQNLEVNLLNNLSLLYESQGELEAALWTWRQLEYIADLPGKAVAKSYHYREAWLLMQKGDTGPAAAAYERAYAAARDVRDLFHMDLIARAAGFLAYRRDRIGEARWWFQENLRALQQHGDGWNLPRAWASLGYLAVASGDVASAGAAFSAGLAVAEYAGRHDLISALTKARAATTSQGFASLSSAGDFYGVRLEPPKAKLTTPFRLADLSSEGAFDAALHTSVPDWELSNVLPASPPLGSQSPD